MRFEIVSIAFILVLIAGCSGALETTTPTPEPTEPASENTELTEEQFKWDDSPFGAERIIVGINDTTNSSNNFTYAASAALQYWNEHVDEYGRYDAHFVLKPNATNPDIEIRRAKQIDCPKQKWSGCAPIPRETTEFSNSDSEYVENSTVIVRSEYSSYKNWRIDRNNVVHEIGHVLGLNHNHRPIWALAPAGKGIRQPVQDVSEASYPWRDAKLKVYINNSSIPKGERTKIRNSTQSALDYYNSGAEGTRIQNLNLELVDSEYNADIVINAGTDKNSGLNRWGRSVDRDDNLEFFVKGVIYLNSEDIDQSYEVIGRMLAYLTRPDAIPPEFDHVSVNNQQERTSNEHIANNKKG
ncbi:hypothetical protein Harman_25480 [Haloarcula mannanilytica]|uniref:Matrixin n=1 Tax=Haloarcula mannanilytica TaxID=2509225 RepID=A0A4C2EPS2_9EURY|nr:hypothetical protein [Haloarcula mannanilytica]GCF14613.1 hypothetical protein Harman_25480 [Haloarcula mannanilytica]